MESLDLVSEIPSYKVSKAIYDKLSDSDKLLVSPRGRFIDSPNLLYRWNDINKGFVEVYKYNSHEDIGFISIAVVPEIRGQGVGVLLAKNAINGCKSKGMKELIWRCEVTNLASSRLAEKAGFKLAKTGKSFKEYVYKFDSNVTDGYVDSMNEESVNGSSNVVMLNSVMNRRQKFRK